MTDYRTDDSEWNFALAYFKRLDDVMKVCNLHKFQNNFNGWFEGLLVLYDELYPQMKPDEREAINKLKNKCEQLVKNSGGVDKYTLKNNLSRFEREMRVVMKSRGMDMPRKSDPSRALLG